MAEQKDELRKCSRCTSKMLLKIKLAITAARNTNVPNAILKLRRKTNLLDIPKQSTIK
jgi:hypothetical protein